MKEIKTYSTH